jgi:hypothetical protein
MKRQRLHGVALMLALFAASAATAQTPSRERLESDPARAGVIDRTGAALLDQISCRRAPEVASAVNAMLKNRLIRYEADESGVYLFKPTVPLRFLGLTVMHISGFDYDGFRDVRGSTMVGTAPPAFLEIEVAAPAGELRKRALAAGLIEAIPVEDKRGFEVSISTEGLGTYLAEHDGTASSIRCVDYPVLRRGR